MSRSDRLMPAGPWVFDDDVADRFDGMLVRSIPDLSAMRRVVIELVDQLAPPAPTVLDLGCSLGAGLEALRVVRPQGCLYGVDNSLPMLTRARRRLGPDADLQLLDLESALPDVDQVDVCLAVLTIQFLAPTRRQVVLEQVAKTMAPRGVLILVEKLATPGRLGAALTGAHHARKRAAGYSEAQIEAKARSISGVLIPDTTENHEKNLRAAGFLEVARVWQSLNFAAWVACR